MNLIIDAGNTKIKWAVFDQGPILDKGSCSLWDDLNVPHLVDLFPQISCCILSSTRSEWAPLESILEQFSIGFYKLDRNWKLPLQIDYLTPGSLGLDRIAGAAGALVTFPGEPVLIIDMGTAITFDFLDAQGVFRGGNISPGMEIRFQSLQRYTDNLPLVEFNDQVAWLGKSTAEAIQAGVQNGILYEIESYINTLINKYNGLRVILTGGASEYFVKKLKKTIFVDPNLVLKGLNHILEYRLRSKDG